MRYLSTRGAAPAVSLSEAVQNGIAPDGGLYVPERLPRFAPGDFAGCDSLQSVAVRFLRPFFGGDPLRSRSRPSSPMPSILPRR